MQNPDQAPPAQGPASSSPHILVVDDEGYIREALVKSIRHLGYQKVDAASDGAEAWQALHAASYSLVITDHKMPKITGLELIERMRSENMRQPVILMSGTLPAEEVSRNPRLRVDAMLSKPFTFAELSATIGRLLCAPERPAIATRNQISLAVGSSRALPLSKRKSARHILVVDDDGDSRQLTINLLTSSGYLAEGAHDGAAGWEALQTHHYDLVITDNRMPRMTGLEMMERLNTSRMTIPVIMATGSLPMDEFARKPSLMPKVALQKPFAIRDLLDAIRDILDTDNGNENHDDSLLPEFF